MNEISLWFSGAALLVSVIALLHSLSRGRAQARLSYEQKRSDLRQDFHLATLRIVELIQRIKPDISEPKKVIIAKKLADAGFGVANCHKRLRGLSSSHLTATTSMESILMAFRSDANELLQMLELAERLLSTNEIDELQKVADMIRQRVWSEENTVKPQDAEQDRKSDTIFFHR